jgi:hypothetical protein
MSLTSYQAAPPRVFEEGHNALSGIFAQPFSEKIFRRHKLNLAYSKTAINRIGKPPLEPAIRQLPDYKPDELPGCSTPRF